MLLENIFSKSVIVFLLPYQCVLEKNVCECVCVFANLDTLTWIIVFTQRQCFGIISINWL